MLPCPAVMRSINDSSRRVEPPVGGDDEVRARPLLGVGELAGEDALEGVGRHAGARQHPLPLHSGGRADHEDAVELALGAGLVEQGYVEDDERRAGIRGSEGGAVGGDERVHQGLDPVEEARVGRDSGAQSGAVDAALGHRIRGDAGERRRAGLTRVEAVHRGVGVPDRHAGLLEQRRGRRLAHADRAGQAEAVGHGASTAARRLASTSGLRPNQRSKPGTPWCKSMPRPSTATRPRARAASTKGVGSAP
jgi:hypothetical protein